MTAFRIGQFLLFVVFLILFLYISPAVCSREETDLNTDWRFNFGDDPNAKKEVYDDSNWLVVDVPHTWNNYDGQDGGDNYLRGVGWYRFKKVGGDTAPWRRHFLEFDGVNAVADVFVNGKHAGIHIGGYSRFRIDVSNNWRVGLNVIAVRVDNSYSDDVPPLTADFTFFGGIYRRVRLVSVSDVHFDMLDFGGPGVYITQKDVSGKSASIQLDAKALNEGSISYAAKFEVTIRDADDKIVKELDSKFTFRPNTVAKFRLNTTISRPHLWDGRADPYLYTVEFKLTGDKLEKDSITQPLGLRSFDIRPSKGFFLNGNHLSLHGASMHQDRLDKGWAIGQEDMIEDMGFFLEIGATAIRLAHYQHDQIVYDIADEQGIVVWAEVPFVNNAGKSDLFANNTINQLYELIRQNYNHPSIIFWGIANEVKATPVDPEPLLKKLQKIVHAEDPSRFSTLALCCGAETKTQGKITDTRAFNEYFGWYKGFAEDFQPWIDRYHRQNQDVSLGISEYGAGASIYAQETDPPQTAPYSRFHPEQYQTWLHEVYWRAISARPWLWGSFLWNMFDFAVDRRNEGDEPGRNDKGLVTFDRKIRKDAFWFYKAQWSTDKFVYISERRHSHRNQDFTDIRVFSTLDSVELVVNGNSFGKRKSNKDNKGIFIWIDVELVEGENTIQAVGGDKGEIVDEVKWYLSSDMRVNAGARKPFVDENSLWWDVDHFVVGGRYAEIDGEISDVENEIDLHRWSTFRVGNEIEYNFPVTDGVYNLHMGFVEPEALEEGARVFLLELQNNTVVEELDIFALSGKKLDAWTLVINDVSIENGDGLKIRLEAKTGEAIINWISIMKKTEESENDESVLDLLTDQTKQIRF